MREIKFRAYHKNAGEMLYEIYSLTCYESHGKVNGIMEVDYEDLDYPDDIELMQYTGLKDKNGKEIYEGDIVKYEDWLTPEIISMDNYNILDAISCRAVEIIGNTYENPELLK